MQGISKQFFFGEGGAIFDHLETYSMSLRIRIQNNGRVKFRKTVLSIFFKHDLVFCLYKSVTDGTLKNLRVISIFFLDFLHMFLPIEYVYCCRLS